MGWRGCYGALLPLATPNTEGCCSLAAVGPPVLISPPLIEVDVVTRTPYASSTVLGLATVENDLIMWRRAIWN